MTTFRTWSKSLAQTLSRFICIGLLATVLRPVAAQVVQIPDAGLRAAILNALGRQGGDITVTDMESLTNLVNTFGRKGGVNGPLILSLEGLQSARNLTKLDLAGLRLGPPVHANLGTGDLSPLSGLENLQTLDLSRNLLTNITWPTGLTGLNELDLSFNSISDFSFLRNQSGLIRLEITSQVPVSLNPISDFSFLGALTNLTWLDLSSNGLRDFTVPAGLTRLSVLFLNSEGLTNLNVPPDLTQLRTLGLDFNAIIDCSFLSELSGLGMLALNLSPQKDCCSCLAGLTNLTWLDLENAFWRLESAKSG